MYGYPLSMPLREKILYHELYPPKLSTDILSALIAIYLYWQHSLLLGLITTFLPPLLASVLTIRFVDLTYLKTSKLGRYMQEHMTSALSVLRIIADFVMLSGAWYHNVFVILFGLVVILGCWLWGALLDLFASHRNKREPNS